MPRRWWPTPRRWWPTGGETQAETIEVDGDGGRQISTQTDGRSISVQFHCQQIQNYSHPRPVSKLVICTEPPYFDEVIQLTRSFSHKNYVAIQCALYDSHGVMQNDDCGNNSHILTTLRLTLTSFKLAASLKAGFHLQWTTEIAVMKHGFQTLSIRHNFIRFIWGL